MTKIVNFTPHPITIVDGENKVVRTIESSGLIRLASKTVSNGIIGGLPISKTVFGEPEGLPDFVEGTFIIVSQLVKSALPNRTDLLVPAEVVRDGKGNVIGCKSLGL
jgi:hypothetical protein